MSESIEEPIHSLPKEAHAHWVTQIIPGGNGAVLGSERHGWQPVRVSFRAKANQSKRTLAHSPEESHDERDHTNYPRREWSRWEASDIDAARQGEQAGASESIEAHVSAFSRRVSCERDHTNYPRRESNPHLRFRKPLFCPLNYGDMSEVRCQKPDFKAKSLRVDSARCINGRASVSRTRNRSADECGCV